MKEKLENQTARKPLNPSTAICTGHTNSKETNLPFSYTLYLAKGIDGKE